MGVDLKRATAQLETLVGDVDPDSRKGRKRTAILNAASELFVTEGYRRTSMEELAVEVGVAKGTLYLYFPKKIDLLIACIAREKLAWIPRMHTILNGEDKPAKVRLKEWIVAVLTLPSESPLIAKIMEGEAELSAAMADMPPELLAAGEGNNIELLLPMFEEIAGEDHRWSQPELLDRVHAVNTLGLLGPLIRSDWARGGTSLERIVSILADLIVDGLRPRRESTPKPRSPS